MKTKPTTQTCPSLHDDWLNTSGESVSEVASPAPPPAKPRRAPVLPPDDNWLGESDPVEQPAPPKSSKPSPKTPAPARVPAPSAMPEGTAKRPARRGLTHSLAWAQGVACGLALAYFFRPTLPPVVLTPPVVPAITETKPTPIVPTPGPSLAETRPQLPILQPQTIPAKPLLPSAATQVYPGLVGVSITTPQPELPPTPPKFDPPTLDPVVEPTKPAAKPNPTPAPPRPPVINYNEYLNSSPLPPGRL
jgi:hypothetical protein